MKKISLLFLTCVLFLLEGNFSCVFAQSKEYLRTKSSSLAAQEAMLKAKEAALVEYFIAPEDEMEIFVWQSPEATGAPVKETTPFKKEYHISTGNIIEIFVWQNSDLSKDVIVGPDGEISVPLVGRIRAVGMTVAELETKITDALTQFIKSPQVSVMIKQFNTATITGDKNKIIDQLNSMRAYIVGPDGTISYPFVGRIQAAGLSISQLEEKIAEALSKFIELPKVSIAMKKIAGEKIIILGEVAHPGIYNYKGTINLIEAIAQAGDFTEKAHMDSVIVVRGNLSANPEVKRINMAKMITKGATSKDDIILRPNDVIYVPKTFVANFNQFLADIGPLINTANSALKSK